MYIQTKISRRRIALAILFSLFSFSASAATVPAFNTGVDAMGIKLAPGAIDPHWQLIAAPGLQSPTQAIVVSEQHPLGQYYSTADSAWIWSNASGTSVVGATYTFELQFDLTGYDTSSVMLSGNWGVDNNGSILLNGSSPLGTGTFSLTGSALSNFNVGHAFTITGGFVAGINTLDIQVVDTGNPGGLNVYGLSVIAEPVPIPASGLLLLSGIAFLGRWSRRSATRP